MVKLAALMDTSLASTPLPNTNPGPKSTPPRMLIFPSVGIESTLMLPSGWMTASPSDATLTRLIRPPPGADRKPSWPFWGAPMLILPPTRDRVCPGGRVIPTMLRFWLTTRMGPGFCDMNPNALTGADVRTLFCAGSA